MAYMCIKNTGLECIGCGDCMIEQFTETVDDQLVFYPEDSLEDFGEFKIYE
jgi:hypothetical protein